MASKFQFITELYSRTLTKLTGDYESWTGFLRAACYNYKCPFDEQVLIYAQRPNATAVLELEKWNRQFGRWVNAGATGIAVMDEAHGKGRLKHYFDIMDTHATRISRPVPIWSMEPAYTEPVIETLEATFGTLSEKDNLPDAILSASRNAVADNVPDYLRDLLDCRDGSMLEELDMLNAEVTYRRALQSSVAYMLMTRLSLPAMAYLLPEDFEGIYSFDTPSTINALGIATSDIAEMGLREISRTVMQARREQFFAKDAQIGYDAVKEQNPTEKERSGDHGSDLQSAGGLSPAEPAAAPRAGDASGQVRGAAEAVHQEASQGAVYESQDQRAAGGTSGGDRDGGGEDGDAAGGADGAERGRDGGTESRRSPALDGADEQPEAQRGGNGAERSDLQLISEKPARAGSDALPALADNRANLYHVAAYHHFENGFDDKLDYPTLEEAEAAAQGYVAGTMEADGFAYDGAAVYGADTNVCLRVYGDYPDEKAQAQAAIYAVEHDREAELPAFLDTYLIEAILLDDGGRKHTRQEIFAYFQTNRDIATRTKFLKSSYNDIWVEVLAGADKVRVGYHAEKDGLLMWEGSYLSRTAESVFSWGVVTEMTESLIERGEYKIKLGLQNATVMAEQMSFFGTEDSAAVYEVPEEQRVGELFPARQVPQEVIDQALYTAGNSYGSAERIAVFYTRQWPEADCAAFLRREFGAENGRGIEYEGKKYAVWFMEDGIHLAQGDSVRTGHCRTTVTWEQASVRILELLEAGTYLSAPEMEQAQDKVLLEMGDALLMTARDLTEEGRAQGLFPQTLAIHDQRKGYVTEGTFDAYLYQLVERKQKFIAQIMTSKSPVRSAEDVDEQALSYAEIKALASGNPLIKEKMDLDIEVSKLKLLKGNHLSQRYALEDAISKTFPKSIAETQERLAGYGADIATVKAHTAPNADGFSPMTLAGKVYAEKKAAGTELLTLCQNMLTPEPMQIGLYRGLTLELSFDSFSQEYRLAMIGQLRHVVTLGTDVFGNIQRMDNLLESLPVKEQACREKLSELHSQLETAKAEVLKPFPREEELKAKLLRLEELNALLNIDKREPEIVADAEAPEACEQPPARKTTDLER